MEKNGLFGAVPLEMLSESDRRTRFATLQEQLENVWAGLGNNRPGASIVVVPSREIDPSRETAAQSQAYEERMLFLLLLLREPQLRVIYVTSSPIAPAIVDYYLGLLQGVIPGHARARLFLVSVCDSSPRPLTEKLLERPRVIERIGALIPDRERCHLVPYATSDRERDLALTLGVPMFGADPDHMELGTKTGARRLFLEEGVRCALGFEDIRDLDGIVDALVRVRAARPRITCALVKLNEGAAGNGNASVDLDGLPAPGAQDERGLVAERARAMAFEHPSMDLETYLANLARLGGIVEERIDGDSLRSPSVQLRIVPGGEVELLSTHDQLLGGPSGQRYIGCRFPADPEYAALISAEAMKVGRRLAREGVLGRLALDFVVVRGPAGGWRAYAIEINLRKGGTTHPFLTLQFLTGGSYSRECCEFTAPSGERKFLVATDCLESPLLRRLALEDLFDTIVTHGLQFDHASHTGVVFHMLSSLTELGKIGMTAVADSPIEAEELYRRAEERLLRAAARASVASPLPPLRGGQDAAVELAAAGW